MEFKEFNNPEGADYDIKSSLNYSSSESKNVVDSNQYYMQLFDLIGFLEDVTDEEIFESYGISVQEYLRPTAETIEKVSKKLGVQSRQR